MHEKTKSKHRYLLFCCMILFGLFSSRKFGTLTKFLQKQNFLRKILSHCCVQYITRVGSYISISVSNKTPIKYQMYENIIQLTPFKWKLDSFEIFDNLLLNSLKLSWKKFKINWATLLFFSGAELLNSAPPLTKTAHISNNSHQFNS